MANKRKTTTAIVAGVTAVALLLGGTFAWTSISQQAKNEAIVDINPGGRLHDDFNGTNKDVYVENFGDTTTGVPIFARIRLDQYFEVGQDAGINKDGADRKVNVLTEGADINDVKTWVTYKPGDDLGDTSKVQANGNWSWKLGRTADEEGGLPYYMPTFNKNKDSLAADINGTYEGVTPDDIVHYDDYVQYGTAEQQATNSQIVVTKTDTEVYDHDSNTTEETKDSVADGFKSYATDSMETPIDDAHVRYDADKEHIATQLTTGATVMTMAQWKAEGSQPGAYWVYDTDGWAYWAQAIEPEKTTGLLLDSIQMTKVPDDNYYYGINVVAQFATAGDIQAFNSGLTDDETWTSDAEELFAKITTKAEAVTIDGFDRVAPGATSTFTAKRTVAGKPAATQPTFTWTATDADGADIAGVTMTDGELSVASDVAVGTQITVTATATDTATALAEGEETTTETEPLSVSKVVTVTEFGEFTYSVKYGDGSAVESKYGETPSFGERYIDVIVDKNVDGNVILFTVNRLMDLETTLANDATNADNSGVKFEVINESFDTSTLKLTLNGEIFSGARPSADGLRYRCGRIIITTEFEQIFLDLLLPQTVNEAYTLTYTRGDADPVEVTEGTELTAGDILTLKNESGETLYSETYFFYDSQGNMLDYYSVTTGAKPTLEITDDAPETQEVKVRAVYNNLYYKEFEVSINKPTDTTN